MSLSPGNQPFMKSEFTTWCWGWKLITERLLCDASYSVHPNKLETGPFVHESISARKHTLSCGPTGDCYKSSLPERGKLSQKTEPGGTDRAGDDWWLNSYLSSDYGPRCTLMSWHFAMNWFQTDIIAMLPVYCCLSKVKLTMTQEAGQI